MLHPLPHGDNASPIVQVIYRPDLSTFLLREDGRTSPTSPERVVNRFGHLFAQAVQGEPGCWITFDDDARADMARIAANRRQFEVLGLVGERCIGGEPAYVIRDCYSGTIRHLRYSSYESTQRGIDGIDAPQSTWPVTFHADGTFEIAAGSGLIGMAAAEFLRSTEAKIVIGNAAALDAVAALFQPASA